MINQITLLLLVGLVWGQDVYPYFSDMGKQLEFEQNRITIIDVKETRQFISGGGSEFNWLSLISKYEPAYVVAPIKTDFYYVTKFSITKNGKVLSEIDFLNTIGLNEQADSLVLDYQKQFKNSKNQKSYIFNQTGYVSSKLAGPLWTIGWGYCVFIFGDPKNDGNLPDSDSRNWLLLSIAGTATGIWMWTTPKSRYTREVPAVPNIQSYLSNQQVKSLSEAYNRKLYNDISSR